MPQELPESIGSAWHNASQRIARFEARLLLEKVCATVSTTFTLTHAMLIAAPERTISPAQSAAFNALITRREAGEPIAYLLGSASFYGLDFTVTPDVLIPRLDTEVLVDQAKAWIESRQKQQSPSSLHAVKPIKILELGTGSGIIAILLARLCPQVELSALDISAEALAIASANAQKHGVENAIRFIKSDWYTALANTGECFDLIVSNPPYIRADDPHLQQNGLPFEPQIALTDGFLNADEPSYGLRCLCAIIHAAKNYLHPHGAILLEHGYDQAHAVQGLLRESGFIDVTSYEDTAGILRVSGARLPNF